MSLFRELLSRLGLNKSNSKGDTPDLVILEERVLYNAAPLPLEGIEHADEVDLEALSDFATVFDQIDRGFDEIADALDSFYDDVLASEPSQTKSYELVVVDTAVENYQQLVDDILKSADEFREFEIVLLDSNFSGVEQLTSILSGRSGIDALHLVSHGSDGNLQLGNASLNYENLSSFENEISEWKYSLSRDADIFVYGCEVARSEIGESFLEQLSELTETDVAASSDLTGNSVQGGDWDFEFRIGAVEATAAFSVEVQANWSGLLFQYEGRSENGVAQSLAVDSSGVQYVAVTANNDSTNGDDIVLSAVDSSGNLVISPVVVNSTLAGDQKWATVAVSDAADRLVVVWTSDDLGGNLGVYAALFDTSGSQILSEFRVDAVGSNGNDASVAMASNGTFVVTWEGSGTEDADGIYARRFNLNGVALDTNPFSVNDGIGTVGLQSNAAVDINSSNEFVIVWDDYQDNDTENEIFFRTYNSAGVAQNDGATGQDAGQVYYDPSVSIANDGSFVIGYTSDATLSVKSGGDAAAATANALGTGVTGKSYDSGGTLQRTYTVSDTANGDQKDVTSLIFDDGSIVFSWYGEGSSGTGTYVNSFNSSGSKVGSESRVDDAFSYDAGTDLSSPERGAAIVDPSDPGYVIWEELTSGVIAKTSGGGFVAGFTGAGYSNGQLVEGYHLSTGYSVGDQAPTIDPAPAAVGLNRLAANGAEVYDVEATDREGTTLTYSIESGDADGVFAIDSDGVITVVNDTDLNNNATYSLIVAITDNNGAGLSVAKTVNITLVDLESDAVGINLNEDSPYRFTSSDFGDNTGDPVTRVEIVSVPTQGKLFLNGEIVVDGQIVLMTDIASSGFTYLPASNESGSDSLTFRIGDDAAFSPSTALLTFTVAADADLNPVTLGDLLDSIDGATAVNTTLHGNQTQSEVAALSGGGYVVVWQNTDNYLADGDEGKAIYYQLYDSNGSKVGGETRVDTDLAGDQEAPHVIGLSDGGFLVTWAQDVSGQLDVYAQRFDQSGNEVEIDGTGGGANSEFLVSQNLISSQSGPKAIQLSDGGFVITSWGTLDAAVDTDTGVVARVYDAQGNTQDEFLVNDSLPGAQRDVSIVALLNNRFVIGWVDQGVNDFDVKAKVFEAGDPTSGTEFTINTNTPNRQNGLDLAALPNGNFVAIWQADGGQDGAGRGVFGRLFDSDGSPITGEFQVNQTTNNHQWNGRVLSLADGGFLTIYESETADSDGAGIFGRRFAADASAAGDEFAINSNHYGDQAEPKAALLSDGKVVVTWSSADGDDLGADFGTGVFVDRYEFATSGGEDESISLNLSRLLHDNDGSETIQSITVRGIPSGAILSDGSGNTTTVGDTFVDVQGWNLSGISIQTAANQHDDFTLQVEVVTQEASNGDTETSTQQLRIIVKPTVDSISKSDIAETTDEDTVLNISANDLTAGASVTDSETITVAAGTVFDGSTFPPSTSGPNLVWDNVGGTGSIVFDSGVSFTTNSGSAVAGMDNAFVLDGSGGGEVTDALLGGLFDDGGGIELWIQPDSITGQRVLFEWGDENQGIALYQDADRVLLKIHSPSTVNGFTTEPYTLVADGLQAGEFNQIYFMISAGATTTLGDTGSTPDAQLYLNGALADELVDIPGYSSIIDFASFNVAAGLGKRVGNAAGDDLGAGNFQGKISSFEVYDDLGSADEVEARYWNLRSVPKTVEIAGQSYMLGSTIVLPSSALLHVNQDGSLSYDPNGAFETLNNGDTGNDSFSFRIENALGQSDTVNVDIQIDGVDAVDPIDLSSGTEINSEGNDAYFLAQNQNLLSGVDELTFEIMFAANGNVDTPLISYQTTDQPDGAVYFDDFLILYNSAGTLEVFLPGNSGTASIGPLSGIDYSNMMDGGLHSFGFSWDSATGDWAIYVDGVVTDQGTSVAVGESFVGGGELVFGQEQDSPNGDFDSAVVFQGTYHDIRLWDHVRSASEIRENYAHKFAPASPPSGLLANWQFTGLDGSIDEVDIIDSGNSLVLQHASGTGFSSGSASDTLQVNENSANGTQVGFVVPTDVDGASRHTFSILDDAGGRFTVNSNTGEITVTDSSLLNFEAATSHNVTIEVTDSDGGTYQEIFTIEVLDVNEQAVVATNTGIDVTVGVSDSVITASMLNEGDPDVPDTGGQITYTLTSVPTQGQLRNGGTVLGLGSTFTQADIDSLSIRYDHTDASDTDDSFDFTIEDGLEDGVTSSSGTFSIRVTHDNLPTSTSSTISINEDTSYTVQEGDFAFSDLDGDTFDGLQIVTAPVNGNLLVDGVAASDNDTISITDIRDGKVVFVPASNAYGVGYDGFEFRVRSSNGAYQTGTDVITFDVVNDGTDLLVVDDGYVTDEDIVLNVNPASGTLQNDDADGGVFKVIDHNQPTNGSVVVNSDGSFTYTPDSRYHGSDSFEYVVSTGNDGLVNYWNLAGNADDSVGSNDGVVNGPTTIDGDFGEALSFDEVDDFVQIPDVTYPDEFTLSLKFRVGDNSGSGYQYIYNHGDFAQPNSLNIFIADDGVLLGRNEFVTALIDADDSTFRFDDLSFDARPFLDNQWHTYTLTLSNSDGAVVYIDGVEMARANHGATGVLNPTDDLFLGTRNDDPIDRYFGGDLDTMQLFDRAMDAAEVTSLHSDPVLKATVNVTVNSVNANPVVYDNVYGVEFGGAATFQIDRGLLYNTYDADGDPLTISVEIGPAHGTLVVGLDGTFTYNHNGVSTGSDSFTYKVVDGEGGEATATVQIHVDQQGLVNGNEFIVNQDTVEHPFSEDQDTRQTDGDARSSVAVNGNGDYVVVWSSVDQSGNRDLMMRMYDFSGRALSDQAEVSQSGSEDHSGGTVAMDADGNFVVVWTARDGANELDVFARRYDSLGNALGSEFRVTDDFSATMADDFDFGDQKNPSVAMNSNGEFVITWDGSRALSGGGTVSQDIYLRKFAADGTADDIVVVNSGTVGDEFSPSVVLNDSGDAFVAWSDTDGVHARVVLADGTLQAEIQTPTRADILNTRAPSVAIHSSGLIAIAYEVEIDNGGGGSHWETYLQIIDPTNVVWQTNPLGNQFQNRDQVGADVSFADDGSLIMTWSGQSTTVGADANDVFGRRFRVEYDSSSNPYAQAISDEFLISQSTGAQFGASVESLDSENFVVVWTGEDSGGNAEVYARQYGNQSTYSIHGRVFEDVNGDAQLGDAVGAAGATVKIYRDDSTVGISAGDRLIAEVTTDATGAYQFDDLFGDARYWVVVDSKTVASTATLNSGYFVDDIWAEQTYGDGGAKFGGLNASVSDNAESLLTSEHVSGISLSRSSVHFIDFGFSFNVVTNSLGGDNQDDDVATNQRSVQGSLRQFIVNANALTGDNAMRFVPVATADRVNSGDQTWEILVSEALPSFTDGGTTIDGRAYSTDGVTRNNASSSVHGYSGAVGVGDDGIENSGDEDLLVSLDAPELEISDTAGLNSGFYVTAERVEISYVSIHGFGVPGTDGGNIVIVGPSATDAHIHHNMIGARSHEFVSPDTATGQSYSIFVSNADDGIIENNLIGFGQDAGIKISGESDLSASASGWQIRFNEIRSNGQDGVDLNYDTSGTQVRSNLIVGNFGYGIDTWNAVGQITISNNQITGNGVSGSELGGVRLFGVNNVVEHNQITSNSGSGVHVIGDNSSGSGYTASTQNLISQNAIYGNAALGIDLSGDSASSTVLGQGDGSSLNGVADDTNAGNLGYDYPQLTGALLDSGRLHISFEATSAFEKIEVYITNNSDLALVGSHEFGQGAVYLGTFLAADLRFNARTGAYYGSLPTPTGGWPASLVAGAKVTSVAIDSNNNTSEFGTTAQVAVGVPEPTAIDSQVVGTEDTDYVFAVTDFEFSDISNSEFQSIRIESLTTNGALQRNGIDVSVGDVIAATDIQNGQLVFVPAADENGVGYDSFDFSVNDGVYHSSNQATMTIDVTPVNDDPTINPPIQYSVAENQTSVGFINGYDLDGDSLYYSIGGGIDANKFDIDHSTGELSFKATPDYENPDDWGTDRRYDVVVNVNDGNGGLFQQTIEVTVLAENDNDPQLVNDQVFIQEGTNVVKVDLVDLDLPGDTVTATLIGGSDAGAFSFDPASELLTFYQTPDYENPHDADGDNRYELRFRLDDNRGRTVEETFLIHVRDTAEAPTVVDDTYVLNEGGNLNAGSVLANDSYGTNVQVTLVQGPGYGNLTLNTDGTFTYVHGGAEVYSTQFVYEVTDDTNLVNSGTVTLTINPVDDAPVANSDSISTVGDLSVDITRDVLSNDFDVDSTIDQIVIVSQPMNGTVFIDGGGRLMFTPDSGFEGSTSFEYQIQSLGQSSATAVASIDVTPPPGNANPGSEDTGDSGDPEPNNENDNEVISEVDPVGNSGGGEQNTESEDNLIGNSRLRSNGRSEGLADIRNSEPIRIEIEEINLESDRSLSFSTYVYATDVESLDAGFEARRTINRLAVSQFNGTTLTASFLNELDSAQSQFYTQFDITMPSLAMAGTSFLTVGYLAWMVRGGILLTTFMSSLPAWRLLDPLAVLESAALDDGVNDDQSIGQLVDQ